jgi:hypothetical protein
MDFDGTVNEFHPIRVALSSPEIVGFKLHPAFPNPVSQSNYTTIAYELPDESPVSIVIYDAIGKQVATLVDRVLPAGYHQALWYAGNSERALEQGTYFIVMKSSFFVETQKITLLR